MSENHNVEWICLLKQEQLNEAIYAHVNILEGPQLNLKEANYYLRLWWEAEANFNSSS